MKIVRNNDLIQLELGNEEIIVIKRDWIDNLKSLPYDKFGDYIKSNIYPALTDKERKIWNRATISNVELQTALQDFSSQTSI